MREKAHILSSFPLHPYGEHGCGLKLGGKLNVCVLTHNYYAQCNLICGVVLGNGKWELWGGGEKGGEGGYPTGMFVYNLACSREQASCDTVFYPVAEV